MVGITLTSEQIRAAPPEVRRWLEQQVAALLSPLPIEAPHPGPQLVACSRQELRAVLEQIQGLLPVVGVFFELGREAASVPVHGMRALRLSDILRHTRLQGPDQVVECLELLTDALRRVRDDPTVMLCAVDRQGNCYVAEKTAANILALWHDIVAERALQPAPMAAPMTAPMAAPVMTADAAPGFHIAALPEGPPPAISPG